MLRDKLVIRDKEIDRIADIWFDNLFKELQLILGVQNVNPNAKNEYAKLWRKALSYGIKNVVELSEYKLLESSLIHFNKYIKNLQPGSSTMHGAINEIIKKKTFKKWISEEETKN